MHWVLVALMAVILLLPGCLGTPDHHRVFSREWANHVRHHNEIRTRADRVRESDPDPGGMLGAERKELAGSQALSKTGRGIRIGGRAGLGGLLQRDGGQIRYKIEW